jgi:hypothetical protein
MVSLHKDVNMVRHDFNTVQQPPIGSAHLSNDSFQLNFNCTLKYLMAVFWAKNNMVSKTVLGVVG